MHTISEQIAKQKEAFRQLSRSRQNQLRRDAEGFCNSNPGCADHNGFWRGLSARHVLEAYYGKQFTSPFRRVGSGILNTREMVK